MTLNRDDLELARALTQVSGDDELGDVDVVEDEEIGFRWPWQRRRRFSTARATATNQLLARTPLGNFGARAGQAAAQQAAAQAAARAAQQTRTSHVATPPPRFSNVPVMTMTGPRPGSMTGRPQPLLLMKPGTELRAWPPVQVTPGQTTRKPKAKRPRRSPGSQEDWPEEQDDDGGEAEWQEAEEAEDVDSEEAPSEPDENDDDDASVDEEEIGAMVQRSSNVGAGVRAQARALAKRMLAAKGPKAVSRHGGKIKTTFLKFARDANNDGTVAAGATVEIKSQPQHPFRPLGLLVDDASAEDFLIEDIKIGTETLMADGGPIPATQFKGDSLLNRLFTRTGQTSQKIIVKVTNTTNIARPFYASMVGQGLK